VVHQVEFLMDDADAERLRGARVGNIDLLPLIRISPVSF
jgi:hypothetical protein